MIVECNNGRCKLSDNWPHLVKIGGFLDVFSGILLQSEAKRPRSDRYGPASSQHHPRLLECVKCTSFPCLRECNYNKYKHLGFNPVFTSGTAMHDVWIAYTNTRNIVFLGCLLCNVGYSSCHSTNTQPKKSTGFGDGWNAGGVLANKPGVQ